MSPYARFHCAVFISAIIAAASFAAHAAPVPGGTLDPLAIPKYVDPLPIPGKMPAATTGNPDYYEIALRQIQQQVLPAGLPKTTLWAYGSVNDPASFKYPSPSIEARVNRSVRVKWINQLVKDPVACARSRKGTACNFLPHLLPVDQTLHWANPPGGPGGQDSMSMDPSPYLGPVPMVAHLHGAHVQPESDGFPEAWWLPAANNIPTGYALAGKRYAQAPDAPNDPGSAVFEYPNDQPAGTLWFHDHSVGMTRLNVYAGPAGFYFLRGGPNDLAGGLPEGTHELPLIVQDRSFNRNGSLFYPKDRAFFEGLLPKQLQIDFVPLSDIAPIWNPEFFGNTMVVNGKSWPVQEVEPRRYRLRLLNASDSRFLILKIVANPLAPRPAKAAIPLWQIGGDGGFLQKPVKLSQILLGPAERADVIVDFSGLKSQAEVYLINEGPDSPFGGGAINVDYLPSDEATTGQVMKFTVGPLQGKDTSLNPAALSLPSPPPIEGTVASTRMLSLNEEESSVVCVITDPQGSIIQIPIAAGEDFALACNSAGGSPFAPKAAKLGIMEAGMPKPLSWMEATTEKPVLGDVEIWEVYNFTADAHPIHLHQIQFEVLNRQGLAMDPATGMPAMPARFSGSPAGAEVWETGPKDTVIMYPGSVTRIKAKFDIPGLFVWHCHILSHEDNEMMRPIEVQPGV